MDRRTLLASGLALGIPVATPEASPAISQPHEFSDIRESSMYFGTRAFEIAASEDTELITLDSWACGYIAHPASRSTYRQYPNTFEDGAVTFALPGLPTMVSEFVERSAEIFGEDAVLVAVSDPQDSSLQGAFAICQNGVLVQMLCIQPNGVLSSDEAVDLLRDIAGSMHTRDPEFYGRGEMNRATLQNHLSNPEDVTAEFARVRLRSERYKFNMDDGISNFWE